MKHIKIECEKEQALEILTLPPNANCINGNRDSCIQKPHGCSHCPFYAENIEFKCKDN